MNFDLFVIGRGSAGACCAPIAAGHGVRVGVAESRFWGRHLLNIGCVPKKFLVVAAQSATRDRVRRALCRALRARGSGGRYNDNVAGGVVMILSYARIGPMNGLAPFRSWARKGSHFLLDPCRSLAHRFCHPKNSHWFTRLEGWLAPAVFRYNTDT